MTQRTGFRAGRALAAAMVMFAGLAAAPRGEAAQDPVAVITELGNQAIRVLGPSVPRAAREARFRQLIESDFDLPDIARFVLGPYGHQLTPPQQQEFLTLFRESLVQAYSERLAAYAGQPFHVTGSRQNGAETIVASVVEQPGGKPIALDWHLVARDGRDLIEDVEIDGVSMKLTQRKTFAGIVARNGGHAAALLAALRQNLSADGASATGSSIAPTR